MAYCLFGRMADGACRKKINMGTKDYSTLEALSNNDRPVLFIHGSDDHFVPVSMTYENYSIPFDRSQHNSSFYYNNFLC